ncbi:ABC transporter permease [Agrobacterium tumefaciens]|uniref:ABC transporter permease n=1 Tax=Agrobacterium tumefaciens TaxID=358 RepID=UPI001FCFBCB4|nr:ABC transporter permease [Agrobacterium tumefaciens]
MVLVFLIIPSFDTLVASVFDPDFTTRHFSDIYNRAAYFQVLGRTVSVAMIVAILCAVIGYPIAYYIVNQPAHRQIWLLYIFLIPMWMSALVRSYAWIVLLGREGILNSVMAAGGLIDDPLKMMYTSGAVYLVMLQIMLPIQVFNSFTSMKEVDQDLMKAARVLGAKPRDAMRRVFLPLSIQGTSNGTAIIFMMSTGFFVTPALVGGPKDMMLGNLITFQVERLNAGFAAALGVALLISALVGVLLIKCVGNIVAKRLA